MAHRAADTLDGIRAALRAAQKEEKAVCISGARHAMGGHNSCRRLMIDTRRMNRLLNFGEKARRPEPIHGLGPTHLTSLQKGREQQWTFAQKQTGADKLTIGGCLAANIHGRGLKMPPFIGDVESFKLLTAKGDLVSCSRTENAELFRLAIGGYGLFGLITRSRCAW
jgi:FAD/FMN-containing dehydrogenase